MLSYPDRDFPIWTQWHKTEVSSEYHNKQPMKYFPVTKAAWIWHATPNVERTTTRKVDTIATSWTTTTSTTRRFLQVEEVGIGCILNIVSSSTKWVASTKHGSEIEQRDRTVVLTLIRPFSTLDKGCYNVRITFLVYNDQLITRTTPFRPGY